MIAFGPGTKPGVGDGWYVRLWPNPGFAIPDGDGGRLSVRLFNTKPAKGAKRVRHLRAQKVKHGSVRPT